MAAAGGRSTRLAGSQAMHLSLSAAWPMQSACMARCSLQGSQGMREKKRERERGRDLCSRGQERRSAWPAADCSLHTWPVGSQAMRLSR
jgi:hypothetical protein